MSTNPASLMTGSQTSVRNVRLLRIQSAFMINICIDKTDVSRDLAFVFAFV